jgi:hypothetical protein
MLNAGIPNLFELQFAHNGYFTAGRHATQPHLALPLPPSGPLAVHPWWRPLQARLLAAWEQGTAEGSRWAIRSVTSESTYYPLVGADGRARRETFRWWALGGLFAELSLAELSAGPGHDGQGHDDRVRLHW